MKENILLIGMPGCGKSTVGVILAKTLGFNFIDTDLLICSQTGMTLQEYIDKMGIEEFLVSEERAALSISCSNTVIATGGSIVYSSCAMAHLKNGARTVFFDVPLDELERRLFNIKTRGIAIAPDKSISDIYEERLPLYRKYADITVPECTCSVSNIEEMVGLIISALQVRELALDNH